MHGWAQERLQIYLRSLDKVKKSNEPATRIHRGREICARCRPCSGISAVASLWRDLCFSNAPKLEERKVVSGPRRKIPLFLWREESKALCLESFVLKTVLSVWRQLSRMSNVLGFEDVVELGLGKQVFFEYQFVDATVGDEGFLCDSRALFVADHRIEGTNQPDGILHIG